MKARQIALTLGLIAGLFAAAGQTAAANQGTGGRIAFGSDHFGGTQNIFTMRPDGSDVRQLTFMQASQGAALDPAWSPDGRAIAFERRNSDGSVRQIYAMGADGSHRHRLFSDPSFVDRWPKFSPDGQTVIFARCRTDFEACAIYTVGADGHGLTAITELNVARNIRDVLPVYAPDGRTIAFASFNRGGVIAAVYIMGAHGAGIRRVTPTALEALDPAWSPDGRRIAFRSHCCNPLPAEILTAHPDGNDVKRLTSPGPANDFTPSYSPEGDRIVFERDSADGSSVLTMRPDGRDVTTIATDAFNPSWGPGNPAAAQARKGQS